MINNPYNREFIGDQPFVKQVWLCGYTDEASMLTSIVGWAVGCPNHEENVGAVATLIQNGYIGYRTHKTPSGNTWQSFALTDAGFDRLKQIGYGDMYDRAVKSHRWYYDRGSLQADG